MYGLIGYPLTHSFSQRYFSEKFEKEGYADHSYINFPIRSIDELEQVLVRNPELRGFNVTIPYKEQVIPFLDEIDEEAFRIGAVNTVHISDKGGRPFLKGFNTDIYGFRKSLGDWLVSCNVTLPKKALVLGTGGASKAVVFALNQLNIIPHSVSRNKGDKVYKTYDELDASDMASHLLIINTSPLGMFPDTATFPDIPYQFLSKDHLLYDLVYNPVQTSFMRKGEEKGAKGHNGERMLYFQAEKAWEIWQDQQ
jgi:shikimate dehydrogenase